MGAAWTWCLAAWVAVGAGAGLPATDPDRVAGPPPNVLVLVADDLGVDMLGAYAEGADLPPTPHLDALAAQGILFRNAYAQPTCSPTRASALTGRHGFRTGVGRPLFLDDAFGALPLSERTVPELLDEGGGGLWTHAAFGKWHLGTWTDTGADGPRDHGFGHFAGSLMNPGDDGGEGYFLWNKIVDGVGALTTTYATTDTVDETLAFVATAAEPWFAWVSFHAPHAPLHAPPPELTSIDLSPWPNPFANPREHYKAMVEGLDTEIGRLFASMDAELLARTTVVFLGDNGTPTYLTVPPFVPGHAKGTPYEGGVNVPLIVAGPAVEAAGTGGSECAGLVHVVDLLPTVAEWAGLDTATALPGVALDGVSFAPYLGDPAQPSLRSHVFSEGFSPNYPGATMPVDFCQQDLGWGGPGTAALSICGSPLAVGYAAELTLTGAPPFAPCLLMVGLVQGDVAFKGGQLVVHPALVSVPRLGDASGGFTLRVPGGPPDGAMPFDLCLQVLVADPATPKGVALSNAIRAELGYPIIVVRAVRGERYKLVELTNTTVEFTTVFELYDLLADPFEQVDLLLGPLDPQAEAALAGLLQAREDVLSGP